MASLEEQSSHTFSRMGENLSQIPPIQQEIASHLRDVIVDLNHIEHISNGSLVNLTNCDLLSLHGNRIEYIGKAAFSPMVKLETLTLSENKLTLLNYGMFLGLHHLMKLDLSHNCIRHVESKTFTDLTSLSILKLEFNYIRILQVNIFQGLSSLFDLNLRRNQIVEIDNEALLDVPSLSRLNLGNNKLTFLHQNLFGALVKLTELDLGNNDLSTFVWTLFSQGQMKGHPRSLSLYLAGNGLNCNKSICWIKEAMGEGWLNVDDQVECLEDVGLECQNGMEYTYLHFAHCFVTNSNDVG